MNITEYPENPCFSCRGTNFWYRTGEWICNNCHPNNELRSTLVRGNVKLHRLWRYIWREGHEEDTESIESYRQAYTRLLDVNNRVITAGDTNCLYIEAGRKLRSCLLNPDSFWCHACPNSYWPEKEIFAQAEKEKIIEQTMEAIEVKGYCLWTCTNLDNAVICVVRDPKRALKSYPVYTLEELEKLALVDLYTDRMVLEAKRAERCAIVTEVNF